MKGIVLAGGTGSRLAPLTTAVSKQLMPVYDKPMIYYPLSIYLLAGIRDILLITTPDDYDSFVRLLGDGSQWGVSISYAIQESPDGLAQAFILGEEFIDGEQCALILGDNIFFGQSLGSIVSKAAQNIDGATVFTCHVNNPEAYGVIEIDSSDNPISIEEKPDNPKSNLAVTGLYFYDRDIVDIAKSIVPSERGELEITDVNRVYMSKGKLSAVQLGRGAAWLDTGTHDSLLEAGQFVSTLAKRQGLQIACLEEIAYNYGYITEDELAKQARRYAKSSYGEYLLQLIKSI